jgi:hypothetical protein
MHLILEKQRTGRKNRSCLEGRDKWEGDDIKKGGQRMNMV